MLNNLDLFLHLNDQQNKHIKSFKTPTTTSTGNKTLFFSDRLGLIYFEVLILSEVVFLF